MPITYERLTIEENNIVHCYKFNLKCYISSFHLHDEFELIVIVKSHGKVYVGFNVSIFNYDNVFSIAWLRYSLKQVMRLISIVVLVSLHVSSYSSQNCFSKGYNFLYFLNFVS